MAHFFSFRFYVVSPLASMNIITAALEAIEPAQLHADVEAAICMIDYATRGDAK